MTQSLSVVWLGVGRSGQQAIFGPTGMALDPAPSEVFAAIDTDDILVTEAAVRAATRIGCGPGPLVVVVDAQQLTVWGSSLCTPVVEADVSHLVVLGGIAADAPACLDRTTVIAHSDDQVTDPNSGQHLRDLVPG